jgi:hypothetical protein
MDFIASYASDVGAPGMSYNGGTWLCSALITLCTITPEILLRVEFEVLVAVTTGLEREYGRRDPWRWQRGTLYPQKLALTSRDKRRSLGRYSSLANLGHGV